MFKEKRRLLFNFLKWYFNSQDKSSSVLFSMITPSRDKDRTLRHLCENLALLSLADNKCISKAKKIFVFQNAQNWSDFLSTKSYNRLTQRLTVRTLDRLTAMGQENSRLETIAWKTLTDNSWIEVNTIFVFLSRRYRTNWIVVLSVELVC